MTKEAVEAINGKIVARPVAGLKPHPDNPRTHSDEQIELLMRNIREVGFQVPVLVDEGDVILAGHGRVEAAKRLGMRRIPTIQAAGLTEDQKKAFLVADNKLVEAGGWNDDILGQLVRDLHTRIDVEVLGIDPPDVHRFLEAERTGFLDGAANSGGESTSREVTRVSEFVQLNFTLTPEARKTVMDVLKREQQRRGLATSAEALVAMCRERDAEDAED